MNSEEENARNKYMEEQVFHKLFSFYLPLITP